MVALVATGLSNVDIADRMYLNPFTVRAHAQRAMTKLDARDRAQLVTLASQTGLIETARGTGLSGAGRVARACHREDP